VVLGPNLVVKAGTKFSAQMSRGEEGWDEDNLTVDDTSPTTAAPEYDVEAVGTQGKGFVWVSFDEYDEDLAPAWGGKCK